MSSISNSFTERLSSRARRAAAAPLLSLAAALTLSAASVAQADTTETLIYAFKQADGSGPNSGLAYLDNGFFYGTMSASAFRFNACGDFKTVVPFGSSNTVGSGLLKGTDGNLYGASTTGGSVGNYGSIFRLSPSGKLDTVYSFMGTDGQRPLRPTQTADGTFFGVTSSGMGNYSNGSIFTLKADGTLTTLFGFSSPQATSLESGYGPGTALVPTPDGAFYGTTTSGGTGGGGTVFKVTPTGTFSVVAPFSSNTAGTSPHSLVVGADGTIYGRAVSTNGVIFGLRPTGQISTLHGFTETEGQIQSRSYYYYGNDAEGTLILGSDGNLYGIAEAGGANGFGSVFQLGTDGTFAVLYSFKGGSDGGTPSGLIQGSDGHLYGTVTKGGGSAGTGGIFKITLDNATGAALPCPAASTVDTSMNGTTHADAGTGTGTGGTGTGGTGTGTGGTGTSGTGTGGTGTGGTGTAGTQLLPDGGVAANTAHTDGGAARLADGGFASDDAKDAKDDGGCSVTGAADSSLASLALLFGALVLRKRRRAA